MEDDGLQSEQPKIHLKVKNETIKEKEREGKETETG